MDSTTHKIDHTRFREPLTLLVEAGTKDKLDAVSREQHQTMREFVRRTLLRAVMARALMKQHPKSEKPAALASPMVTHPRHEDPGTHPRVAAEIEAARARLGLTR